MNLYDIQTKLKMRNDKDPANHYILEIEDEAVEIAVMPKNCKDQQNYIEFESEVEMVQWLNES